MVVEDGTGEAEPRGRGRSPWLLVVVGFGLGLALGSLIAAPRFDPVALDGADSALPDTVGEPGEASDRGVSGAVPGFPDALVAVGDGLGSGHDYLLWPVGGPLVTRSLSGGDDVRLDASGQFIALSQAVPEVPGVLLSVGRFNRIRAVAAGVTSAEWHDSRAGEVAYTTEEDDEWRLYRVVGGFAPTVVVTRPMDQGGTLAVWGDWGFAIQRPDERIQLLTRAGEPKDIESGVALASHGSGWILAQDEGLKLVSAGGGVRRLERSDVPEQVLAAAFSTDRSRVALSGRLGVVVFGLDDPEEAIMAPGFPGSWLSWSSDSRFLVAPAQSGVFIHDLENETSRQVLVGHTVLDAQVLPLSTSE